MDNFIGQISQFGFNFAPRGWAFCQGQILPISQNAALFSLLGTNFGGNGTSTFGLPDLRSRVALHAPSIGGTYALGEQGGEENVTVLSGQMPMHTHTFGVTNVNGDKGPPTGHIFGASNHGSPPAATKIYGQGANTALAANTISFNGSSLPHTNLQPYLAINYSIALTGYFPSRS